MDQKDRNFNYKRIRVDGRRVALHRYLMEQKLGRRLLSTELVHHKDEDKEHNIIENLEVKTRSAHSKLHASTEFPPFVQACGERIGVSKLTEDIVRSIRTRINSGEMLKDIASSVGVNKSTISRIKSGKIWAHVMKE